MHCSHTGHSTDPLLTPFVVNIVELKIKVGVSR